MTTRLLKRVAAANLGARTGAGADAETQAAAAAIIADVRQGGVPALLEYAGRFDGWVPDSPWVFEREDLARALAATDPDVRAVLERAASRIRNFALAQRAALTDFTIPVSGGSAGHTVIPMDRAGCYAPSGRYPLPSSLLMTAVTARAAGVREVIVATPRPGALMLATAAIAGADRLIGVGGAHAVAALAYGVGIAACDIVVGPGNRWVTAAKKSVAGDVAIDMLAGPSELVVVADSTANAATVAADLLAQAEHDPDAFPVMVTMEPDVVDAVERELALQLVALPAGAATIARAALANGVAVICANLDEMVGACDALAPEHLQLSVADPEGVAARCRNAGACFLGETSAEVFGDYGVGGNHVLPTNRGARFTGGLSVLSFLRVRTWLRLGASLDAIDAVSADVAALARIEGLEAHARAAERRGRR